MWGGGGGGFKWGFWQRCLDSQGSLVLSTHDGGLAVVFQDIIDVGCVWVTPDEEFIGIIKSGSSMAGYNP